MEMYNQDEQGLWDSIYDELEFYGKHNIDDNLACFEFWTDTAGQDVVVEFDYDGSAEDFINKFVEYAEFYDPDEEAEMYVRNGMLGKQGVPDSLRVLLDDCEEAKNTLMEIAESLSRFLGKSLGIRLDDEE